MSDGIRMGTNASLTVAEAARADDGLILGATDADGDADERAHSQSSSGYTGYTNPESQRATTILKRKPDIRKLKPYDQREGKQHNKK